MKTIITLLISLLLCASPSWARMNVAMMGGSAVVASGDSEIIFYSNANSITTGQSPEKGSGTITIGASVTSVTGQVGNAWSGASTGWSAGAVQIPSSSNINWELGTLGLYINRASTTGAYLAVNEGTPSGVFEFSWAYSTNYNWKYKGGSQQLGLAGNTTTYFLELAWNNASNLMSYRVDGGSWTEVAAAGTAPTGATLRLLNNSGDGFGGWLDQVMISNVYQKDLYAARNTTSF